MTIDRYKLLNKLFKFNFEIRDVYFSTETRTLARSLRPFRAMSILLLVIIVAIVLEEIDVSSYILNWKVCQSLVSTSSRISRVLFTKAIKISYLFLILFSTSKKTWWRFLMHEGLTFFQNMSIGRTGLYKCRRITYVSETSYVVTINGSHKKSHNIPCKRFQLVS